MLPLRHTHGSAITRLTASLTGHERFMWRLHSRAQLQSVKKTYNCRYARTKYSASTDEKRRYGRSEDIAEL